MKQYKNVNELYADNEKRRHSGESDYGVWWKSRGGPAHLNIAESPRMVMVQPGIQNFRVTWIHDTGEFYVQEAQTSKVWLTDKVCKTEGEAEAFMDGWASRVCGGCGYVEDQFPELAGYLN